MSNANVPLMVPKKLRAEIRAVAKETGLKQADVMRQSITYGLPNLRAAFQKLKSTVPLASK